ncbi:MAG TPA: PIN domain-containing protein [Candidatus Tectomicrobia bacterium]
MRLYLDSAPVIYLVEEVPNYAELVDRRVSVADVVQVVSDLTRMECRVKPLREGNTALLQYYDDYFAEVVEEIVVLSRAVIDRATDIRARYGFRTPDAIHLAAAVVSGCDVFLTNDHRLDRFPDIAMDVIQP